MSSGLVSNISPNRSGVERPDLPNGTLPSVSRRRDKIFAAGFFAAAEIFNLKG